MRRTEYHKNQKINNLTYIEEAAPHISKGGNRYRRAKFLCHCGKYFITVIGRVKSGHTASCGCLYRKHGLTGTTLYAVLKTFIFRCNNPKSGRYHRYGARGIKVCKEWMENPRSFYDWANSHGYKAGLQIDRIDNDGDYCPSNCRFVTQTENVRNSTVAKLKPSQVKTIRVLKSNNPNISHKEIANIYGVAESTIAFIMRGETWVDI
jgi:hypothetical protein